MKRLFFVNAPLLAACLAMAGCGTPGSYRQSYSTTGAVIGAGTGALVGGPHGWPVEGAVAGALIGGAAGAAAGADVDQKVAVNAQNQAYLQAQALSAANPPVSKMDLIYMSRANGSDDVIINKIQSAAYVQPLTPQDLIDLKNEGVSDRVTNAMIIKAQSNAPPYAGPPTNGTVTPPSATVTTYYEVVPPPYYGWNFYLGFPWPYYYGPRWPYYRGPWPYYRPYRPAPWVGPGPRPGPGPYPGPRPGPHPGPGPGPHPGPPR